MSFDLWFLFGFLILGTSAISVDIEERLYAAACKMNISCITISQRLALHQFHKRQLALGIVRRITNILR